MNINMNNVIGIAGLALGTAGIGFMLGSKKNLDDAAKTMDVSVKELLESGKLDIPDSMIEKAVTSAVADYAKPRFDEAVKEEVSSFRRNAMGEIKAAAGEEIAKQKDRLKDDVVEALNAKINLISVDDIYKGVVTAASKQVASRLDSDIERMVKSHEKSIEEAGKIYSSVAKRYMTQDDGKFIRIRLD